MISSFGGFLSFQYIVLEYNVAKLSEELSILNIYIKPPVICVGLWGWGIRRILNLGNGSGRIDVITFCWIECKNAVAFVNTMASVGVDIMVVAVRDGG